LWKYEVEMLKIIIIIMGYTLNKIQYSYHNIIVDDAKIYNWKFEKRIHFLKKHLFIFVNPRQWYAGQFSTLLQEVKHFAFLSIKEPCPIHMQTFHFLG
jgi:hypothetical protein